MDSNYEIRKVLKENIRYQSHNCDINEAYLTMTPILIGLTTHKKIQYSQRQKSPS